jgi:phosphoglycolate phosphatase
MTVNPIPALPLWLAPFYAQAAARAKGAVRHEGCQVMSGVVVFDLDGTLADTAVDLMAAANACLPRPALGPGDELTAFAGGRAMLRAGFARLGDPWDEAMIDAAYPRLLSAYADAICVATRLYPGAGAALDALRAEAWHMAICTNKPEGLALRLLDRLGVLPFFDAVVGADTLPVRKPDPAPYRLAVDRCGGGRSFLLGDTVTDRDTGRAAGVPVALVGFGPEGPGVARLAPDAILHAYADLPALADRWLRA